MELGRDINEIRIGDKAYFTKTVTEIDFILTLGISGDYNPLHFNEEYARTTPFRTRIAPGTIGLNFLSALLGMKLPGRGTVWRELSVSFMAPVRAGDTITVEAEVVERDPERNLIKLEVTWCNQKSEEVMTGTAVVIPPVNGGRA